jgi:large subunit ribosomal protein L17
MIHRRKGRKLGRTTPHRKATLSNLSVSLITHKKISTTLAKAKELRRFVEPLLTKSRKALALKTDKPAYGLHLRREAYKFLRDKTAVKTLFDEIAQKTAGRNGGYTRVLKLGRRLGDAAEMAVIELVDYNTGQQAAVTESADSSAKSKTAESKPKPKAKKTTKKAAATKEKTAEPKKKSKKKEAAK